MFRIRPILAVAAAALTLAVSAFSAAPAKADPYNSNNSSTPWYQYWEGYEYKCYFGSYKGHLYIEHVSPSSQSGSYNSSYDCCYWTGWFYRYNSHGDQIGSYPCSGYAKKGSYVYFKIEGDYNWVCMGRLQNDLKKMGGDICDFDHCSYGDWYCEYYDDHSH